MNLGIEPPLDGLCKPRLRPFDALKLCLSPEDRRISHCIIDPLMDQFTSILMYVRVVDGMDVLEGASGLLRLRISTFVQTRRTLISHSM